MYKKYYEQHEEYVLPGDNLFEEMPEDIAVEDIEARSKAGGVWGWWWRRAECFTITLGLTASPVVYL